MSKQSKQRYIIARKGNKVSTYRLLEDIHDRDIVAERRSETPVSLDRMKEWLKEDRT